MNVEMRDKLVESLNALGSIQVVRDDAIPGCSHFGDRTIVHFRIMDQAGWAAQRLRILKSKSSSSLPINMHLCQQFMLDETGGKEELLLVNTMEVEGDEKSIAGVVAMLRPLKGLRVDSKLPQVNVPVGGVDGRLPGDDLTSGKPAIRSKKFSLSDMGGGR